MPNTAQIVAHLQALADYPGTDGCALVETATGMALHVAGDGSELERIGVVAKGDVGWQAWSVKVEALRRVLAESLVTPPR